MALKSQTGDRWSSMLAGSLKLGRRNCADQKDVDFGDVAVVIATSLLECNIAIESSRRDLRGPPARARAEDARARLDQELALCTVCSYPESPYWKAQRKIMDVELGKLDIRGAPK